MNDNTRNYIDNAMVYIDKTMERVESLIEFEERAQKYFPLSDQDQAKSDDVLLHLNHVADLLQEVIAELKKI